MIPKYEPDVTGCTCADSKNESGCPVHGAFYTSMGAKAPVQQRWVKVSRNQYGSGGTLIDGPNLTEDQALENSEKHNNVLIIRLGLDEQDDFFIGHAINRAFVRWLRDKDHDGIVRSLLADHLEVLVQRLRNGEVLDYIDDIAPSTSNE